MHRISDQLLQRYCAVALDQLTPPLAYELAYEHLGTSLARWVLRAEVLSQVAEHEIFRGAAEARGFWKTRPGLPANQGSCWIIFVLDRAEDCPVLKPAFVLPLEWRKEQPHSGQLPPSLAALADRVLQELSLTGWGLWPSQQAGMCEYDLSAWHRLRGGSGWASLAGGLIIAAEGGTPERTIWATGEWRGGNDPHPGFQRVDHLHEKLALASRWGVRRIFVPASQREEAKSWSTEPTESTTGISTLPTDKPNLRIALREYLAEFGAPPDIEAPAQARIAYYLRQLDFHPDAAKAYYRRCLLAEIVCRCRNKLSSKLPPNVWPSHLVTIVSKNPEVVELSSRMLAPARVLAMYTSETECHVRGLLAELGCHVPRCSVETQRFDPGPAMGQQMRKAIGRFAEGLDRGRLAFDLTPGSKEMSLALALELAPPGSRLLYVRHRWGDHGPQPLTEEPVLWTVRGAAGGRQGPLAGVSDNG